MSLSEVEHRYVREARVGRLATADGDGRPNVVPVCFALHGGAIVSAVDEKPKATAPGALRRVRDVRANPTVALVVDHYTPDWTDLGWVQVRGTAALLDPGDDGHADAVRALREKYDQYATHDLSTAPVIRIDPGQVRSWGRLDGRPSGSEPGQG